MLSTILAAALAAVSTAEQREQLSLTVYNQDFGLVREVRELPLDRGRSELEFADVAATIQPETVWIRALGSGSDLRVLEQSYQYDLLSPEKLLEKYVGRSVRVYRHNEVTGRDEQREATVLSVNGGVVLQIGDEITFGYPGRLAFPELPENLIARPTLRWQLESAAARPRVEVSYLARQLSWQADYVLVVAADDASGSLTGWVTLDNRSGATWRDARLKLVAGDVQRVGPEAPELVFDARMRAAEAGRAGFAEEGLFEYHLYTLERPTTLLDQEQKQITLLEAPQVNLRKRLIFRGQPRWYRQSLPPGSVRDEKVGVFLEIDNKEDQGLGMPLPKGVVRVYKADSEGAQQFLGEDRIDHTPRDETFRIRTGQAFDVVADRTQTEFEITGQCTSESAWRIEVRNHKDGAETVEIVEGVSGDWKILTSTHPPQKEDAQTFRFTVAVPARGSVAVEYRVRVRWC